MKCEKARAGLSALLDDELAADDRAGIEQHLAECPSCAQERELLDRTWQALDVWDAVEAPEGIGSGFWERVRATGRQRASLRQTLKRVLTHPVSVAAVLALVLGLIFGNYLGDLHIKKTQPSLQPTGRAVPAEDEYMAAFDDMPADSIGGAYVSALPQENEPQEGDK